MTKTHRRGRAAFVLPRSDVGSRVATRVLAEWAVTALISMAVVIWLSLANLTERTDHVLYDTYSRMAPADATDQIVVIGIDDRSLNAIGPWPWPRDVHARLIQALHHAGSGPVAYDVLFMEPREGDEALAAALGEAGNVHLPALLSAPGFNGAAYQLDRPVAPVAAAAASLGHVMLTPDQDGTVRHLPLWLTAGDHKIGHLVLPLARSVRGDDALTPPDTPAIDALEARAPVLIRYPSPDAGYRVVSFVDVVNGEIDPAFLRDRLILVGATAHGMGDRFATSLSHDSSLTPGVEIQAALLQTVVEQSAPRPVPMWLRTTLALLPLTLMLFGFVTLRPGGNTVLGVGLLLATLVASAMALKAGWWWPPMSAIFGVLIAWPLWSWRRLAAAYGYMQAELANLRDDSDSRQLAPLSSAPVWKSGDEVSRQVRALSTALKQLKDFNRFITQSVRSLPDAAVIADMDDKVLVANARARKLFGEAVLKDATLATLFNALGHKDWRHLMSGEEGHDDIQLNDGRALQVATAPLTDVEGQSAGNIVRFADVTQLRASERQRERTLQLLGHDMRAPQVSILTLLDNAKRPEDFENRIRANAQQTLSLADGYVQLSRAESQMLRFEVVDLGLLLTEAADMMWPQAAAKGVDLSSPEDGYDYLIEGDASLLRRVMINLMDNAIRHTPTGGRVRCDLFRRGDDITMTIADEGPGFDPEAKSRMFQPFQGGNIAGSGLGLAFVHTVIQRHGGRISLDAPAGLPQVETSSCFYITLPSAPGAEA